MENKKEKVSFSEDTEEQYWDETYNALVNSVEGIFTSVPESRKESTVQVTKNVSWTIPPFLWRFANDALCRYPFGTCQHRKLFPHYYPQTFFGNKFIPLRGAPHRGPGCYVKDTYGLAYNLTKIPTSKKGYTLGARTAPRFQPTKKDVTPYPGKYQPEYSEEKKKQSFAPFNVFMPRFKEEKKVLHCPGPGTYNPSLKPPAKITWPMKFGSPDWAQVPCLQKRTLKTELSTDREFRKHRNRVAYLSLFYN